MTLYQTQVLTLQSFLIKRQIYVAIRSDYKSVMALIMIKLLRFLYTSNLRMAIRLAAMRIASKAISVTSVSVYRWTATDSTSMSLRLIETH